MYHIKTMNKISKVGLAQLDDRFEISDTMEQEDAILVRSAKLHDYDFPAALQCIARAGAGVNNIPLDRAADSGVVVFNTPGANANGVKELTLAALLLSSRKIAQGVAWVKEQSAAGEDVAAVVEKGPPMPARNSWAKPWAWWAWGPSASWWPTPPPPWAWTLWAMTPSSPWPTP